jgi:hypothetical protein
MDAWETILEGRYLTEYQGKKYRDVSADRIRN